MVELHRSSAPWRPSQLLNNLDRPSKESLWPLRQQANLCNVTNCRRPLFGADDAGPMEQG
ncbi:hypothetical protein SEUCBS139899_010879 [Sporothrix eucalyptigena]